MIVYCISGLAADASVFKYIQLPSHCKLVHLSWIPPLKNESLNSYALRLARDIDTTEPFSLMGLSFGGMIATEIGKNLKAHKIILISSIPHSEHLPGYYRMAARLGLHRIITASSIKFAAKFKRLFIQERPADKKMLKKMIERSDDRFICWAIRAVLTWENKTVPPNLYQLHGTRDEVLPKRFTHPTHVFEKAGHLMIMERSKELNKVLNEILS